MLNKMRTNHSHPFTKPRQEKAIMTIATNTVFKPSAWLPNPGILPLPSADISPHLCRPFKKKLFHQNSSTVFPVLHQKKLT